MNSRRREGHGSGYGVGAMRLSITCLGWELLALELEPTAADEAPDVDGGYLTSTPVGFIATHELPDDSGLPYREGWE